MASERLPDFDGRVAIVTGAGQGMGREHAVMLASHGARVVVNDVSEDAAARTAAAIVKVGGSAVPDAHDVVTGAAGLIETATATYGRLDIVVNNAGINAYGRFSEMDADLWWRIFDTSFRGAVEVSRHAMTHLIQSGTGRLINVASNAMFGLGNVTPYAAAKAAIWGLGNALAIEAHEVGVQVNTILPVAWTPMTEAAFDSPVLRTVLRELFPASSVSAFVAWLAHQDTNVHGQTFEIGGTSASKVVASSMLRVEVQRPTPNDWAHGVVGGFDQGIPTPIPNSRASLHAQLTFLAPDCRDELPAEMFNS